MREIIVHLGPRSYPVVVGIGALSSVGERLRTLGGGSKVALVSDRSVMRLHGGRVTESVRAAGFALTHVIVPEGESAKALAVAERCWDELLAAGMDRTSTVLALGGGAICDLAGFVAATYMRGINVVQLPTTVLAQVDASIGGKTAIEHPRAKNLIGAFHQPRLVLVDPGAVVTLPDREFRSRLAEAARLAHRLGHASLETVVRQERLLEALGLAVRLPDVDHAAVLAAISRDKKSRDGKVPFVFAPRIGEFRLVFDVPTEAVRAVLAGLTHAAPAR